MHRSLGSGAWRTSGDLAVNIVVLVSGRGTDLQSIIDATQEGWLKVNIQAVISDKEDAYALERANSTVFPLTYFLRRF